MENTVQTKFFALLIALSTFFVASASFAADDPTRATVTVQMNGVQAKEPYPYMVRIATGSSATEKATEHDTFTFHVQPGNNTVVIQTVVIDDKVYYGQLDVSEFKPGTHEQVEVAMQPLPVVEVITDKAVPLGYRDRPKTLIAFSEGQLAHQKGQSQRAMARSGAVPVAGYWVLQPGTYKYNGNAVPKDTGHIAINGKVTPFDVNKPLELAPGDHVVISFGSAVN